MTTTKSKNMKGQPKRRAARPAKRSAAPKARRSAPLGRAFQIITSLIDATRPLSSAEIAELCDLDTSTTHRLLQSLGTEGYVVRDNAKRYVASPKLLFPLPLYHPWNALRRDAEPTLIALRDQLGLTTGLVVFFLGERILVEMAIGRDPLSPDYRTWLSSPLHASGSGKVMLMGMTPSARRNLLGDEPYEKFTKNTLVKSSALDADIAESTRRGYAIASDDFISGFRVVAAPVRTQSGVFIGCLFCSGRGTALTDGAIAEAGAALKKVAEVFFFTSPALQNLGNFLSVSP